MSTHMVMTCDGCGANLDPVRIADRPAISGRRANGLGGGGLPSGDFDWCVGCATVAFDAVRVRVRQGYRDG